MQNANQANAPLHLDSTKFADEYEGHLSVRDNMLLLPTREGGGSSVQPTSSSSSIPTRQAAAAAAVGPESHYMRCPHCTAGVKTTVRYTTTTRTHTLATRFWCCGCLPYCMDSAKNTDHYCPNCLYYIGTYIK